MKHLFTLIFPLLFYFGATGHNLQATDTVNICGHRLVLQADVKLTSTGHITGPGFTVVWENINEKKQERQTQNILKDLARDGSIVNKFDLDCYFLFSPCKAYGITVDSSNSHTGLIILSAIVKQQPIYVQITLSDPVFKNEGLPLFINNLITLSR